VDLQARLAELEAKARELEEVSFGTIETGNIPTDEYFAAQEAGGELGHAAYEEQATRQRVTEQDWNLLLADQLAKKQAEAGVRPARFSPTTECGGYTLHRYIKVRFAAELEGALGRPLFYDESEIPPVQPDHERIYHGTPLRNIPSIDSRGLMPGAAVASGEKIDSVLFSNRPGDFGYMTVVADIPLTDRKLHGCHGRTDYCWGSYFGTITADMIVGYYVAKRAMEPDELGWFSDWQAMCEPEKQAEVGVRPDTMAPATEQAYVAQLQQRWTLANPELWLPGHKSVFITTMGEMYEAPEGGIHDDLSPAVLDAVESGWRAQYKYPFDEATPHLGKQTGWVRSSIFIRAGVYPRAQIAFDIFRAPTSAQVRAFRRLIDSQVDRNVDIFIRFDVADERVSVSTGDYAGVLRALRERGMLPAMGDTAELTIAPAVRVLPEGGPTTAAEMIAELDAANFVDLGTVETMLGDRPEYLDAVASFIMEQREKLRAGMLMPRDVAKAYVITVGSQRAQAIDPSVVTQKSGFIVPERFTMVTQLGARVVRPEDATGAWLLTPEGQHALDAADQCQLDFASWNLLAWMRQAWGSDQYLRLNVFGGRGPLRTGSPAQDASWYNMTNICALTDALNECHGDSACLDGVIGRVSGVGAGKLGFMKHLVGLGDTPTVDAIEVNFWLTGKADVRQLNDEDGRLVRSTAYWEHDRTVRAYLLGRFRQLFAQMRAAGIGADLDPDVYAHIVHHWLWDKAKGARTEHVGMYEGQMFGATLAENPELTGLVTDALASEYQAISMYDNIVGKAGLGDNETRLVAESILVDEKEHAGKLDFLLNQPKMPAEPEEPCALPEPQATAYRWPDPEWQVATRATPDEWNTAIVATLVPIALEDIPERLEDNAHLPLLVTQDGQAWRGKSVFDIHDMMATALLRHLGDSRDYNRVAYVATLAHLMRLDIEDGGLAMELWEAPTASQLRTTLAVWSLAQLEDRSITVELHLPDKPAVHTNADRRNELFAFLRYYDWMPAMAAVECEEIPFATDSPVGTSGDLAEWVSGIGGSPGIVVDADEAKAHPCIRMVLRPGHELVYAKGIIGPLDDAQKALYCQQGYVERQPTEKQKARMQAMSDAAKLCRVESVAPTTEEHLVRYFSCLGRELKAKGVQV